MQRRRFLQLATVAVLAPALRLAFPYAAGAARVDGVSYGGRLYRAGGRGKILTSADGGASWTLHSDLGDMYAVSRLAVDRRDNLRATVDFAGRAFSLTLGTDRRSWFTA